jgi:nicotinate-nucleotide--dimethylbenzimidazole phosphoribosyltransferase
LSQTLLPFDDIRALLRDMPEPDLEACAAAMLREGQLIKPQGALGRLEDFSAHIAAWPGKRANGKTQLALQRPLVAIFAGAHGVTRHGVSAYPDGVNRAMLAGFSNGQAAINQICKSFDLGLKVFDLAIDLPTNDITLSAAMEEAACAATIGFGMEAIANGTDLLCLGEMGIGNTTIAAAIYTALYGGSARDWVGRGTGVDDAGIGRKISAVEAALACHAGRLTDPLEVLRRLGGREIAAMVGAILAARIERVPVILDGYVVCAAAAIVHALSPEAIAHCLAGHCSNEGAHGEVLSRLGLRPILDLSMRLGEGTGAALAAGLIKAALACHTGMASFSEAGVPIA